MVHLICRLVPRDSRAGYVVLAMADLAVPWTEILGRPEAEIIGMLAGFYLNREDCLDLSGLSGGCTAGAREA